MSLYTRMMVDAGLNVRQAEAIARDDGDVISISMFTASDDAVRFQSAIDAAAEVDGVVFVPPGLYQLGGSIEIHSGVVLFGCGYSSVVKLADGAVSGLHTDGAGIKLFIYTDGADNVGLDNLVIDGNHTNNSSVYRAIWFESGDSLFVRRTLFKNANGIALGMVASTNFELAELDFKEIIGNFPDSPGMPGEGIYVRDSSDGLIRGIRGKDIDDHLIYLDGGASSSDNLRVINAKARNCGRESQSSAFNTYQNVKRSSWTDCHAVDCGTGFTAITTPDGSLFPTDLEYNGCTSHVTFGSTGCSGFSASGTAGRVNMRLRYNNCKAYKSGDGVAEVAHGFDIQGVDDVELNKCTARENNDNGVDLINCRNFIVDVKSIDNSRRSSGSFQGIKLGDGTADGDCIGGTVNIFATDTAGGGSKKQGYGAWVRGTSSDIQFTGRMEGNATGRLLKDSGVTNVGWAGIYDQGSNSNGRYVRHVNGEQECWHHLDALSQDWLTAVGDFFTPAAFATWTFPITFSHTADLVVTGSVLRNSIQVSGIRFGVLTNTTATYAPFNSGALNSSSAKELLFHAIGRWY